MKMFLKKSLNILMVLVTLLNMFLEPIIVLANEPVKGDLAYADQYVSDNNESVEVIDGTFTNEGDVQVKKTVTKLDDNGNYEVKFEIRGKDTSSQTSKTAPIYAVIVFDRSNSMKDDTKWSNAKTAARTFAEKLIEKYSQANIALVTFGKTAKNTTKGFENSNLKNYSDDNLFGYQPYSDYDTTGATNLQDGLVKAQDLLNNVTDTNAKKYVVVISDGAPTTYGTNGNGSDGGSTSYDDIDKAVTAATNLKNKNVEIFTVGYDLSSDVIYRGSGNDKYKNSTAESILKLISTDENHYISSNQTDIIAKLSGIVSTTTVYSPAATNIVIKDNIGSSFVDSKTITFDAVDKTTSEWQEVGKFNIQIDENSTTGWHNTNDNFEYSYESANGKVNKVCTKNPQVYWVQPKYSYAIEYYYDNVIDSTLTENGSSVKGAVVSVSDEKITANTKMGYKLSSVYPSSKSISISESGNVIRVYYVTDESQTKDLTYTIEYYKNNVKVSEDTYTETKTVQVLEDNMIKVDMSKVNTTNKYKGFTCTGTNPEILPEIVESGSVIKIYYERNLYTYTIYHVEKGTSNILAQENGNALYGSDVDVNEKTFAGYTFDSKSIDVIKIDVEKNVAYVYYTKNVYSYKVEYYLETLNGKFEFKEAVKVNDVFYGDKTNYEIKTYLGYNYDETMTENPEKVLTGEEVVRLYYRLGTGKVIIHYVVKVDDEYIPFTKAAYDKNGKLIANFEDVELGDDVIVGKITSPFTTSLRNVYEYALNGIYEGNIITNTDAKLLEGQTISATITADVQEYTYVYSSPKGGNVPPQTGSNANMYANYVLLLGLIYLIKKYKEAK